jgi:hypothetical protein
MMGAVEYFVVVFPGNQLKGRIALALIELTERGTIRTIDLLLSRKMRTASSA